MFEPRMGLYPGCGPDNILSKSLIFFQKTKPEAFIYEHVKGYPDPFIYGKIKGVLLLTLIMGHPVGTPVGIIGSYLEFDISF